MHPIAPYIHWTDLSSNTFLIGSQFVHSQFTPFDRSSKMAEHTKLGGDERMKDRAIRAIAGGALVVALSAPTLAAVNVAMPLAEVSQGKPAITESVERHGGRGGGNKLEEIAKQRGITVEQLKQERRAQMEQKLADEAKKAGMTVEQYKAKLKTEREVKRQARLEQYAKEKGITLDQAKAELKERAIEKMAKAAKELGITADELKAKMSQ